MQNRLLNWMTFNKFWVTLHAKLMAIFWQKLFKPDSDSTSPTLSRSEPEWVWNVTKTYFCQVGYQLSFLQKCSQINFLFALILLSLTARDKPL